MTTLAAAVRWNETLASLWAEEMKACGAFLSALREFDEKEAWKPLGYSGLFRYLTCALGMSEAVAYRRLQAVRLSKWCPEVVSAIVDGRLCFSVLSEVSKVATPNNWKEVLPRFFGASKKQALALAAGLLPADAAAMRDVIVPMPLLSLGEVREVGKVQQGESAGLVKTSSRDASTADAPVSAPEGELKNADAVQVGACADVIPQALAEVRATPMHRIHFTASETFVRKLQKAKDAVAHRVDASRLEAVLEQALEALLEKEAKRPKAGISQAARREVQARDEGQCQWPLLQGGVCGEKQFLQVDHILPRARGGDANADNLRLLCARYNREAAQRVFSEGWMEKFGSA
ncbi:MAG: HNH endonuclease [Myxococcaceae bacterium]